MEFIKIVTIGIIGTFLALSLKKNAPEFSVAVIIITGIIMVFTIIGKLSESINALKDIYLKTGLDFSYMKIVMKVMAIAYISEFAVQICKDAQCGLIASKIEIGGKLIILSLSVPIITELINTVTTILS